MPEGHKVSALREKRHVGNREVVRYRGRCSCGTQSFMHYSTPIAAKTAMERTHITSLTLNERKEA